jgi:hypothetical protein
MKNKFTLLIILSMLFLSHLGFSQKIGAAYLPAQTAETPEFFKVFYQEDYLNKIDVFELDKAANAYEVAFESKMPKLASDEDIQTGEENEDIYILYYKRWRRTMSKYVQENGRIKVYEDTQVEDNRNEKNVRSVAANWKLLGPTQISDVFSYNPAMPQNPAQANIYSCAMAPSNHDILYAGCETGAIYKTIDKGLNWTLALDENTVFPAIAIDPTNSNIVYGGANSKIAKSTDGGVTWTFMTPPCGLVNGIAINPSSSSTIFMAAANGLYKSTDAGMTWAIVSGMNTSVYDVFLKPMIIIHYLL